MKKPIVIASANHKGGAGKTTLATALILGLAEKGHKVLAIDGDMQKNLNASFGIESKNTEKHFFNAIENLDKENYRAANYIIKTEYENIDFIPSHAKMAELDMQLFFKTEKEHLVEKIINDITKTEDYNFIIFDTGSYLGNLNFAIFIASDYLIIPVQPQAFDIDGLIAIRTFYKRTKLINSRLKIIGIALNRVDPRESITEECISVVEELFPGQILKTQIGLDTTIKRAQFNGVPFFYHSPNSRATLQYKKLVQEVLDIVQQGEN